MVSIKNKKNRIAVCLLLFCSLLQASQLVGCSSAGIIQDEALTEASDIENRQTPRVSEPTVYETENFIFALPKIWQNQVTVRVEDGPVADSLVIEWHDIPLAVIGLEETTFSIPEDLEFFGVWNSRIENSYCISLWVYNYAYIIPHSIMDPGLYSNALVNLTDEEREKLLYLSTGGEIDLEKATDYCQIRATENRTKTKTKQFYKDVVAPCIDVTDLPGR